jgi:hypothetical protein
MMTRADKRVWLAWVKRVEQYAGLVSLDGDQDKDGYSLNDAYDAYNRGWSPRQYADYIQSTLDQRKYG